MDSATAMLESRLITGDKGIFEEFENKILRFIRRNRGYLLGKIEEQNFRYQMYDSSIYVQEPNIKESSGGLRDIHLVLWFSKVLFGYLELKCLYKNNAYQKDEIKNLQKAYDFLLRLRNELHFLYRSKKDVLTFNEQSRVAKNLGYRSGIIEKAEAKMLGDYYLYARNVNLFKQDFIERFVLTKEQKRFRIRKIDNVFQVINSDILTISNGKKSFAKDTTKLMKIFELLQKYNFRLSGELKIKIKRDIKFLNKSFSRDVNANRMFLLIVKKNKEVEPVLRLMHELGILDKLIPEFGKVNCFVYYDNFHRYTADEHILIAMRYLDGLLKIDDPKLEKLSKVLYSINDIHILRLAILFHDLGKIYGPYHTKRSVEMIPRISKRMNLNPEETSMVEFLVRYHIVMSNFIQTRDLDDEDSISEFSNIVATHERLNMLYILTYCDISAVAPGVWTDWKHNLLWALYHKVLNYITLDEYKENRKEYLRILREEIINECISEFSLDEINEHLNNIHEKYVYSTSPQTVKEHIRIIEEAKKNIFSINVVRKEKSGITVFTISTIKDRIGLLSDIVGTLTFNDMNILSAKVYTRSDGIVIDEINIEGIIGYDVLEKVYGDFENVLLKDMSIDKVITSHRKYLKTKRKKRLKIPTTVEFDNKTSENLTIIDVKTQDRIGLLYLISKTLSSLNLNIEYAKIFTEGDKALDVFYVNNENKQKITSRKKLIDIKNTLADLLSTQIIYLEKGS
jgi:[protein-PII] uridylyltransferase